MLTDLSITGTVVDGRKLGKTLEFPTANLDIKDHGLDIKTVQCGKVKLQDKHYNMVLCVNWENVIEVHVLDYHGDNFYTENLEIYDLHFIRHMEKIDDMEVLKQTIQNDITEARRILN